MKLKYLLKDNVNSTARAGDENIIFRHVAALTRRRFLLRWLKHLEQMPSGLIKQSLMPKSIQMLKKNLGSLQRLHAVTCMACLSCVQSKEIMVFQTKAFCHLMTCTQLKRQIDPDRKREIWNNTIVSNKIKMHYVFSSCLSGVFILKVCCTKKSEHTSRSRSLARINAIGCAERLDQLQMINNLTYSIIILSIDHGQAIRNNS